MSGSAVWTMVGSSGMMGWVKVVLGDDRGCVDGSVDGNGGR